MAFGLFPIVWIVVNAIYIYNVIVETGHFDTIRNSLATLSNDRRIQVLVMAFVFGALLEAIAGFGVLLAPVPRRGGALHPSSSHRRLRKLGRLEWSLCGGRSSPRWSATTLAGLATRIATEIAAYSY